MALGVLEAAFGQKSKSGPNGAYMFSLPYSNSSFLSVTAKSCPTFLSLAFSFKREWSLPFSQIEAACIALSGYRLKLWFAFNSKKKTLVGKLAIFAMRNLTKSSLKSSYDNAVREYARVEHILLKGGEIPPMLGEENRDLYEVWEVVSYFGLQEYQVTCGKGKVKMKAMVKFTSGGKRLCTQNLVIKSLAVAKSATILIKYCGKEAFSADQLAPLGLNLPGLSILSRSLRLGFKHKKNNRMIPFILDLLKRYVFLVAKLAEENIITRKFPKRSADVFPGAKDPEYSLLLTVLESLGMQLTPWETFVPQPLPEAWRFDCFQETKFSTLKAFLLAQQCYTKLKEDLCCLSLFVQLQIFTFDEARKSVTANLALLHRVADLRVEDLPLEWIDQFVSKLIACVEEIQASSFTISKLSKSWFTHSQLAGCAIVPDVTQKGISVLQGPNYTPGTLVFEGLKLVAVLRQMITFEQVRQLLPAAQEAPLSDQPDRLLIEDSSKLTQLLSLLRKKYWAITVPNLALSFFPFSQTVKVVEQRTASSSALFARVPAIDIPQMLPFPGLPDEAKSEAIGLLLDRLSMYHSKNIAHLMLIPPFIFFGESSKQIALMNMMFGDYNLRTTFDTLKPSVFNYIAYIDPGVLSYLYWKSKGTSRHEAKNIKEKKLKYLLSLNPSCDIHSVGMLIYSYIWSDDYPFDYVYKPALRSRTLPHREHDTAISRPGLRPQPQFDSIGRENSDQFLEFYFLNVVKPHRSPLISEEFEKAYPQFTDVLRRCFMRQRSRPKVGELKEFVKEFVGMKAFVKEKGLSKKVPILRNRPIDESKEK